MIKRIAELYPKEMYTSINLFCFSLHAIFMDLNYYLHMLERAFNDPIVIYDKNIQITYEILHDIFYERSRQVLESYALGKSIKEATDLEALIFLFSLGPTLDDSLQRIYEFLKAKYKGEQLTISYEEQRKLRSLKQWLQDLKNLLYFHRHT